MNNFKYIFSLIVVSSVLSIVSCTKDNGSESAKEVSMKILTSKIWSVSSVVVPLSTATDESDWQNFMVKFTETTMTSSGYPTGSSAVWPSGAYMLSNDGKTITRADGVVMLIINLNETTFNSTFTVPSGTIIGGRIAELGGDYTFNMK